MNVNLTPQLEELVRAKVASGLYTSASEVVREALRLMDEQDRLRAAKLEQLRDDIRQGVNSGPSNAWNADEVKREGLMVWLRAPVKAGKIKGFDRALRLLHAA